MDLDKAFSEIMDCIKNDNFSAVRPKIDEIINSDSADVYVMLKCASLLKSIDDEKGCQEIIDKALTVLPEGKDDLYNIGIAIRGLGRAEDAYELISDFRNDPEKVPEVARTLMMIDESEEALDLMLKLNSRKIEDRLLLCDILCELGEFTKAIDEAASVAKDDSYSYRSLINQCTVLFKAGHEKEAMKIPKELVKADKKNADALALNAYVMWMDGKVPAATNYANRALHIDINHIGALEIMALCLIQMKKIPQAKVLAGAINQQDPGNPAVVRILDICRLSSNV